MVEVDSIIRVGNLGGIAVDVPFFHPGQFKWQENTTVLENGGRGDQPLVLRRPLTPIVMPMVMRSLNEFKAFAAQRRVVLELVNLEELFAEWDKRVQVLSGVEIDTTVVWAPLIRPVQDGFQRELIALMTLALFFFGNTEFAFAFIFCITKNSKENIRRAMKKLWDNA